MEWIAYCREYGELDRCPNGQWAEAEARVHGRKTGHAVLIGYDPLESEKEPVDLPDILTYESTGIARPE